jgi:GTP-binding protein Era
VAVIGVPNAGKSTLVNHLVGAKVAIVTPKVQTTRARIMAVTIEGASQIILVDTPGMFAPKRRLERAMVGEAWTGATEADLVALLVDAETGFDAGVRAVLEGLKSHTRAAVLVLNKIDRVQRPALLALSAELNAAHPFEETFMIQATNGDGVKDLKSFFARRMPEGPWLYPEDQLADMPERLLASEITREKLFLKLRQEVPYDLTVETEKWTELGGGAVRIEQIIYVRRDTQKSIVLGAKGQMIKQVGAASRLELERLLDRRVHLFLFVKVRENWQDDPERYRAMGLPFPG